MDKSVQITLIIVAAVVVLGLIFASNFSTTKNTITGTGYSEVKVTPDLVKTYLNIEAKGATVSEAKDKSTNIYNALVDSLVSKGFASEDIKTQSFSINPNYIYNGGKTTISGYVASQSIVVEIGADEIEKLSSIIDSAASAGVSIGYISFELSQEKENTYKSQAISLASEDARLKAEALAQGVGKSLGGLVSVSDNSFSYSPWVAYQASAGATIEDAKASVARITPSDQTVSASVTAVFKIR